MPMGDTTRPAQERCKWPGGKVVRPPAFPSTVHALPQQTVTAESARRGPNRNVAMVETGRCRAYARPMDAEPDYTSELAELLGRHGFRSFGMTRTAVGHLKLVGTLGDREIDIVVDTGASRTFAELSYCRSHGIDVTDTGKPGHGGTVHTVDDARLELEGLPLRTDGLLSLDMSNTNKMLAGRGVEPICAVIGQDALRNHQAVIDYATLRLFLNTGPTANDAA
jgi:hypothetical protein